MADAVWFQGSNQMLNAPEGQEDVVGHLPVLNTGEQVISCWKMTEEELVYINETGLVWFSIYGQNHAPIKLAGKAMVTIHGEHPETKSLTGGEGNA